MFAKKKGFLPHGSFRCFKVAMFSLDFKNTSCIGVDHLK